MKLNRTIYADKDGLISQLQVERDQAQGCAGLTSITQKRREFWRGKVEGLNTAIRLLQHWAGEVEPE